MREKFEKILAGYKTFREKYVLGDASVMSSLSLHGQKPQVMVVACCDSRVDPAVILQCAPGDLFVVRNVANIIPPYEKDEAHHGTSAALEFGICFLGVKHLILLGHSQCGGIESLFSPDFSSRNDFISRWVDLIKLPDVTPTRRQEEDVDTYAKRALEKSYENALLFPWIQARVAEGTLQIHLWFFDIKGGEILTYSHATRSYVPLSSQATYLPF